MVKEGAHKKDKWKQVKEFERNSSEYKEPPCGPDLPIRWVRWHIILLVKRHKRLKRRGIHKPEILKSRHDSQMDIFRKFLSKVSRFCANGANLSVSHSEYYVKKRNHRKTRLSCCNVFMTALFHGVSMGTIEIQHGFYRRNIPCKIFKKINLLLRQCRFFLWYHLKQRSLAIWLAPPGQDRLN